MANGLPLVDVKQVVGKSSEIKAQNSGGFTSFTEKMLKEAQTNFTRAHEGGATTSTKPEANQYEEPTMTPADQELATKLVNEIMVQGKPKTVQEAMAQAKKIVPEKSKQSKGFWASVWETIKKLFTWNWDENDVARLANDLKKQKILPKV